MNESKTNFEKIDAAASAACVKSGVFALLLSVALFFLTPYLREEPSYTALRKYVASRLNLGLDIDSLADDALWVKYKASHTDADSMPVGQLVRAQIDIDLTSQADIKYFPSQATPPQTSPPKTSPPQTISKPPVTPRPPGGLAATATTPPKTSSPKTISLPHANSQKHGKRPGDPGFVPSAPTGLTVTEVGVFETIPEGPVIVSDLAKLNDSNTLTRARQVSNFFDLSIARWVRKRNALTYKNVLGGRCQPGAELEAPYKPGTKPPNFVPALTEKAILECLTVQDIVELARYEQPPLSNPTELGGRISPKFEMTPGSLPQVKEPYLAAVAVEAILLFVIVYFGAYVRQAVSSPSFPAPETLFGAFSTSPFLLISLLIALWSPAIVSGYVAWVSGKWMWIPALLVFGAVAFIFAALQSKSYFGVWQPFRVASKQTHPDVLTPQSTDEK